MVITIFVHVGWSRCHKNGAYILLLSRMRSEKQTSMIECLWGMSAKITNAIVAHVALTTTYWFREDMRFSVIIPTKNRFEALLRALRSLDFQEFNDFEIIVVNDFSIEFYDESQIAKFSRVIYVSLKKGIGAAGARNEALKLAKGEWVVFLDDDDEMCPSYLSLLSENISEADKLGDKLFWCSVEVHQNNGVSMIPAHIYPDAVRSALSIGVSYGFCASLVALKKIKYFDERFIVGEDTDLIISLIADGVQPEPLNIVGVRKYNDNNQRLSFEYKRTSDFKIGEMLLEKHSGFFCMHRIIAVNLSIWLIKVHCSNSKYASALRLSFYVIRLLSVSYAIDLCAFVKKITK